MNHKSNDRILVSLSHFIKNKEFYYSFFCGKLEQEYGLEREDIFYRGGAIFLIKDKNKFLLKVLKENIQHKEYVCLHER